MDPDAVSSPPLATRPPTQPTQMFTRTRTSFDSLLEVAAAESGCVVSTLAEEPEEDDDEDLENSELRSTQPMYFRPKANRPSPTRKRMIQPPFSIFTAMARFRSAGAKGPPCYAVLCVSVPPMVFCTGSPEGAGAMPISALNCFT